MAKFAGHVVPGTCYLLMATWWLFNIYRDFFKSIAHKSLDPKDKKVEGLTNRLQFRSRIWYPDSLCRKLPLEIAFKLVMPLIGIISVLTNGSLIPMNNFHHSIMPVGMILDGVINLMVHHKWPLPKFSDTASFILNIVVIILVFESHQQSKTHFGQELHTYIIGLLISVALLSALQAMFRSNAMVALLRAYCLQLFATWLIQIGFIIEPPFSVDVFYWKDRSESMLIGFLFACYSFANALLIMAIGAIVYRVTRKQIALEKLEFLVNQSSGTSDGDTDCLISSQSDQKIKGNDSGLELKIAFN